MGPRAGLNKCKKSAPPRIRSPDRPPRSQSLYRLSYPAHSEFLVTLITLTRVSASPVGGRFVTDRDVMRPLAATRVTQAHILYFLPT